MTTIGPCLAFYTRHATEVESLIELRDEGKLKPGDDTSLFNEVYARASFEAASLVERILTDGTSAARASDFLGKKSDRGDWDHRMDRWEAYTTLCNDGSPTDAILDVAIHTAAGGAWLVASVGVISGNADDLVVVLKRQGFEAVAPPSWWAEIKWDNVVPLAALPLNKDTQVEDLEAACRKAFEALGPHLRAVVEFAASK